MSLFHSIPMQQWWHDQYFQTKSPKEIVKHSVTVGEGPQNVSGYTNNGSADYYNSERNIKEGLKNGIIIEAKPEGESTVSWQLYKLLIESSNCLWNGFLFIP